jgi:putative hemolysin
MRLMMTAPDASPGFSKLSLSLATTLEEIREVQRLRYKIFVEAMGLSALANPEGRDEDEFDAHCDHLIVRDTRTLEVVGTYRILGPQAAGKCGRFYSEQEFDLCRLENMRGRIAETGRACIHPDYRNGAVIMLLWGGLVAYMKRENCDYLIGCASVSLADGGHNAAALYHALSVTNLAPAEYRVTPHLPFPIHERETNHALHIPPLIKGYLRAGAWICGEPAWDPDFHCADFFMLLQMAHLDQRYARRYLEETRSL